MSAIIIEVCERTCDRWLDEAGNEHPKFHAQIEGSPGHWSAGRTRDEAVGDLIASHPEKFNISITHLGRLPR